jgi:excisionase family DNA binding protein
VLNTKKQPSPENNTRNLHPASALATFERLLDSDEAASLLGIHKKTLQRMARNGQIPGIQIGDLWRFRASALDEWLASKLAC